MRRQEKAKQALGTKEAMGMKDTTSYIVKWKMILNFLLKPHLPRSRSFRGPYLSMTMPMGRVMADSRKEPTVKARFSISSWSLQMVQPFISRYSSAGSNDVSERLRLELLSERWQQGGKYFRFELSTVFSFNLKQHNAAILEIPNHNFKILYLHTTYLS